MEWLQQLMNGISIGSIYALIALGYTMVYGIIKLINFAHGDVVMIGAFTGFYAIVGLNLSFIPALLLAMAVCSILGVIIERVAYRRLRNSSRITALITAIGVSFFIEYTFIYFRGAQPQSYPKDVLPETSINIFGAKINSQALLIFVITIVLMIILQLIVHRTKIGKAMRAVSIDPETAMLMGISVDRTISATFAIGSALAGAAGVIIGIYFTKIEPLMGLLPGIKAFVAAVLGGIGIIPGAMVGGFILGLVETAVSAIGFSNFRDAAAFFILILILIFKPTGIFGKNVREKV